MSRQIPAGPKKTREIQNHHFDSTIWNQFRFRNDDIVIASYPKAGTTWLQQIVAQLVFGGAEDIDLAALSPWLDLRVTPSGPKLEALERQSHRRFIKTHLPVDALVFSPKAKYIYIARDGRDIVWSLHNHHLNYIEAVYHLVNDTPGRIGPPLEPPPQSVRQYFLEWMERDGYPAVPFWQHVRSWWKVRTLPNVLLVHYNELSEDLEGSIRRIAEYLGLASGSLPWHQIVDHCSFSYMKAHAQDVVPMGGAMWRGGVATFLHKGINGRWRDVLTANDIRGYEEKAERELGVECAHWLAAGTPQALKSQQ